jgi:hypothetical protein
VYEEAQSKAIKANEWLLPEEAGFIEPEGVANELVIAIVIAMYNVGVMPSSTHTRMCVFRLAG